MILDTIIASVDKVHGSLKKANSKLGRLLFQTINSTRKECCFVDMFDFNNRAYNFQAHKL